MARIRIVDEWLRSPVSAPARQRAIMVVARSWAEQRVLMRAFSASDDQTRPTITLHGSQLAIGPAGTDPHGEWGIHVEPPVDGRAQELREALQLAARLLAGSKGTPARLQDEVSEFEDRATNNWSPTSAKSEKKSYYEPAVGASMSTSQEIPSSQAVRAKLRKTPAFWGGLAETPELGQSTDPAATLAKPKSVSAKTVGFGKKNLRRTFRYSGAVTTQSPKAATPVTKGKCAKKGDAKTVFGFSSAKNQGVSYAVAAGKTMPLGFTLDAPERTLLTALGRQPTMTAAEIGRLLNESEPMAWMAGFMDKLADLGLDLVAPGEDQDGEPTYVLTR